MTDLEIGQYYYFDDDIGGEHFRVEGKLIHIFVNPTRDLNAKCLLMAFPVWPENFERWTFSPDTEEGANMSIHDKWREKMKKFPTWRMRWVKISSLKDSTDERAESFIAPLDDLIKELSKDIK